MNKLVVVVLVLLVAVAALGYWQEWFSLTKGGTVNVDTAKFKEDKAAFSRTVGEKAQATKEKAASLWKNTEGLTGDDKAHAQKELAELEKKHDRLAKQLKELEDAGEDKFESIKQDLSKALEEVERKTEELTKKLKKEQDK